jgi:hypothetical protein
MSRYRLSGRRVELARLNAAGSALGLLLGWRGGQTRAFVHVLADSSWRHCRRAESHWILARCDVASHAAEGTGSANIHVGHGGAVDASHQ